MARSNTTFMADPMSAAFSLLISARLPRLSVILLKRVKSVGSSSVSIRYEIP